MRIEESCAREVGNCGGGREGRRPSSPKKGDEENVNHAAPANTPASRALRPKRKVVGKRGDVWPG